MSSQEKKLKKAALIKKLYKNLHTQKQIIVVSLMNVASKQVQEIRRELAKSNSELIIGKNTVIRKAIQYKIDQLSEDNPFYEDLKSIAKANPALENLKKQMTGKVGLIFSSKPAYDLKPLIENNKLETAAKVGSTAPNNVVIPAGPTNLDPSQISFFHALKISTKIQKGQIELTKDFTVCTKGKIVGQSEATLLQKLDIKPFKYGMEVICVYDDGSILQPDVVALTNDDILKDFSTGLTNIAALSMQLGLPTVAAVPHMVVSAFKNLAAVSLQTPYKLKQLENMSQAPAQAAPQQGAKAEAKKEEPKKEEPKEEEQDVDMGGLFDF